MKHVDIVCFVGGMVSPVMLVVAAFFFLIKGPGDAVDGSDGSDRSDTCDDGCVCAARLEPRPPFCSYSFLVLFSRSFASL
jgi:hypothetical protein